MAEMTAGESNLDRDIPVHRDQGDGAPTVDTISRSEPTQETMPTTSRKAVLEPFTVFVKLDLMQIGLFIVAMVTRMWRLDFPRAIVFDELHFGRFASMYMKQTFHFDVHPPLGKMLFALAAYYTGYDGNFVFDKIGTEYNSSVPVLALRMVPAMLGSLVVPVVYQIMVELGMRKWTAALAASLVIFDNAMLVQSRFMLLDSILLFFLVASLLCYLKFRHENTSCAFSLKWWLWLGLMGVFMACTILTKYSGVFSVVLILVLVGRDLWTMLPDDYLSDLEVGKHVCARVLCLLVIPTILYVSIFYVHLTILTKAGPHDDVMTSAFQASLEGGLASITKGQPLQIAYGSQVTLRHTYGEKPCWLHSHAHLYPLRYPDNRGSSHQQQVTCYSFKDVNNWWIVKDPKRNSLMVDEPIRPVKHGDVVQLIHGLTSRALNSHDVAAPLSPQQQEVTCYIDYNISLPAQNLWKVEILNREEEGDVWHTIKSHIRLIHVNTSQVLKTSSKQLPDWGFYQFEVVTDRFQNQDAATWNVEEHRYTRNEEENAREKELAKAEMIPLKPTLLSFWTKFSELQFKMLFTQHDMALEHKFSSHPLEWPVMDRNVAYWVASNSSHQLHLIGNPVIWCSSTVALLAYSGLLVFYLLRRRRLCLDLSQDQWDQMVLVGELFLGGYLVNYVPYFTTERTLFLHHYFPALLFKLLLLAFVVEHVYNLLWGAAVCNVYVMVMVVWMTGVFNVFLTFLAFSYGTSALNSEQVRALMWRDTWDFFIVIEKKT